MAYDGKLAFDTGIDTDGFKQGVNELVSLGSKAAATVTSTLMDAKQTAGEIGSEFKTSMSQVSAAINAAADTSAFDTLSSAAKQTGKHISDAFNRLDISTSELKIQLSQIDRALQLNPGNTELLTQKYTVLGQQVTAVRERLEALKNAEAEITAMLGSGEISLSQYDAYRREVLNTEAALRDLISAQEDVKTELTLTVAPKINIPDIGTVLNEKISEILNNSSVEMSKLDEQLSQINKSLQLNPGNTELLAQKFTVLGQQIAVARDKLESLKSVEQQVNQSFSNGEIGTGQYDAYRRSVLNAEASLRQLIDAQNDMVDDAGNIRDVSNEINNLDDAMDNAGKSAITFGDLLKSNIASEFITEGLHKAAGAVTDFVGKGIKLASDLQEVRNVVDVTFGDGAEQIYKWSDAAAESYGMSSLAAQDYNGTMGAMLKSMGLTDDAVIKMSTDMVGLAGDMASFYNLDVEQAFEKIRSGISGETEPLKQLGINMSVANLEAYALSQSIETAYEKMSQSEQAILRYNYLMSATADAQGDFSRTSDSFANQQRIMQLNIENLSASLGEKLLPHINDVIVTVNEKLPKAERSIENIGEILGTATSFALEHHEAIITLITAYGTFHGIMKAGTAIQTGVTAIKSLTAATKTATVAQEGMNAAAAANPYVLLASAIAAVTVGLISLVSAEGDASKALKETAEESVEEYENQKEKVSELETELESVRDRITEIQSKGKLNFTDTEELTNLQLQNQELSARLEIEKELLETKKQQAEYDLYNAVTNDDTSEKGTVAYVENRISAYKEALSYLEYWQEELNEAIKNKDDYAADEARKNIQIVEEAINKEKLSILEGTTELNGLAENLDYTTEKGKKAKEEIDGLNSTVREMFDIAEEEPTLGINMEVHGEHYLAREGKQALQDLEDEKAARDRALQDKIDYLEKEKNLEHLTEEEYYSELKNYLDENADYESVLWHEQRRECEKYQQQKLDAAKKEADEEKKIAEDTAKEQQETLEKSIEDQIDAVKERQELNDDFTEEMMYNEMEIIISGLDKESDLYKKYNSEILKGRKKLADEQEKTTEKSLQKVLKNYQKAYDELEKKRETYRKKLLSIGGDIFSVDETEDKNGNKTKTYTVNNIDEQIKKMREYHAQIKKLKEQDISDGLLEELTSMNSDDSAQFAKYLSGMSEAEFGKINSLYKEKDDIAKELSEDLYKDEAQKLSDNMTVALVDLAVAAYDYGKQTAEQFAEGFNSAIDKLGIDALYGQYQAAGATKIYENYATVSKDDREFFITVDLTGKSNVYMDSTVVGTIVTDQQTKQRIRTGG